jgi:hypothetical protein
MKKALKEEGFPKNHETLSEKQISKKTRDTAQGVEYLLSKHEGLSSQFPVLPKKCGKDIANINYMNYKFLKLSFSNATTQNLP